MKEKKPVTLNDVLDETRDDIFDQEVAEMKQKLRKKMSELKNAKKIVANLERDIEEIKLEIEQELETLNEL